ncbi:hypothetical protein TNCV_678571 [Trichonephila clavipes]|nr:hypothetical protein TNCV_678571 [Trichonephila clavipes]
MNSACLEVDAYRTYARKGRKQWSQLDFALLRHTASRCFALLFIVRQLGAIFQHGDTMSHTACISLDCFYAIIFFLGQENHQILICITRDKLPNLVSSKCHRFGTTFGYCVGKLFST